MLPSMIFALSLCAVSGSQDGVKLDLSVSQPAIDDTGSFVTMRLLNNGTAPVVLDSSLRLGVSVEVYDSENRLMQLRALPNQEAQPLNLTKSLMSVPPGWQVERRLYFGRAISEFGFATGTNVNNDLIRVSAYYEAVEFPKLSEVGRVKVRLELTGDALTAAAMELGKDKAEGLVRKPLTAEWKNTVSTVPTKVE